MNTKAVSQLIESARKAQEMFRAFANTDPIACLSSHSEEATAADMADELTQAIAEAEADKPGGRPVLCVRDSEDIDYDTYWLIPPGMDDEAARAAANTAIGLARATGGEDELDAPNFGYLEREMTARGFIKTELVYATEVW